MDPYLVRLAEAAEAGSPCPVLRLLVGGRIVIGRPARSRALIDAMQNELPDEYARRLHSWNESQPEDARIDPGKLATDHLRTMLGAEPVSEPATLTLVDVEVWGSGSRGLALPVARVPLAAIELWSVFRGRSISPVKAPTWTAWQAVES